MITSYTFWWIVLAMLVAYLGVSMGRRSKAASQAEAARLRAIEQEHPPRAFDPSVIVPQVERVRQNHTASAHGRSRPSHHRIGRFASARRLVAGFAYFRRSAHEHDLPKHGD